MNKNKDYQNASGCTDLTAFYAINNVMKEENERFHKLLNTINYITDMAGFRIEGRIVIRDKKTGRVWK